MRAFAVETLSSRGDLAEPSYRPAVRNPAAQAIRLAGALVFGIGAVLWLAHAMRPTPDAAPTMADASQPVWRDIDKPAPLYRLDAPDFIEAPLAYSARLHVAGGGREDTLSLGRLDGTAPALRLRIFRRVGEAPAGTPLFAAIAHEAAQAGLSVERSGLAEILPTRFGRFEIVDVALAGASGGAGRTCSGFRLVRDAPALSITGLACGAAAASLPRPAIACLVDRLDLAGGGDDQDLSDFFARSEASQDPSCPAAKPASRETAASAPTSDAGTHRSGKPATSRKSLRRR